MENFLDSLLFTWVILPILIFLARICDVSLDTMRIIMIGRGRKLYTALIGFVEVCIWLLVARQVILRLPNLLCFFAYAGGFAMGNFVGMWIEERAAVGAQIIRIIVTDGGEALGESLRAHGHGVTIFSAQGAKGPVCVIHSVLKRSEVKRVSALIKELDPKAFFTIEDVKHVNEGVFPANLER
jgi:uncharacterized protein YebE (UPF0316 family)